MVCSIVARRYLHSLAFTSWTPSPQSGGFHCAGADYFFHFLSFLIFFPCCVLFSVYFVFGFFFLIRKQGIPLWLHWPFWVIAPLSVRNLVAQLSGKGSLWLPASILHLDSEVEIRGVWTRRLVVPGLEGWCNETIVFFIRGSFWGGFAEEEFSSCDPEQETTIMKQKEQGKSLMFLYKTICSHIIKLGAQ